MSTADTAVAPGGRGLGPRGLVFFGFLLIPVGVPIPVAITWRNRALNIAAVERPLR